MNKPAEIDNEVLTKTYVDQFHNDNERNRRDIGFSFFNEEVDLVKNNQDNDFNDKKLKNKDSITVNRDTSDYELSNKKYIDYDLNKNIIVRNNQTPSNYLKDSVGNDVYNRTKYDKLQIIDTIIIKSPTTGGYLFQN